jgi:FlaA1/EpsC-like NDP-sugar epimerase
MVVSDLIGNPEWRQDPVGFLDDDSEKHYMHIHGIPVFGDIDLLPQVAVAQKIDVIAIAIANLAPRALDRVLAMAQKTGARVQIIRGHAEALAGQVRVQLRDLNLDRLRAYTAATLSRAGHGSGARQ